nr:MULTISPECIES: hypothetical protein [unclassified Rhodococcus (in: high G+C Gram-positive bacteria)]
MTRAQSASARSANGAAWKVPALLWAMSSGPKVSSAWRIADCTDAESETSVRK